MHKPHHRYITLLLAQKLFSSSHLVVPEQAINATARVASMLLLRERLLRHLHLHIFPCGFAL